MTKPTDIRVLETRIKFRESIFRTPIKFGGRVANRAVDLDVLLHVRTASGRDAHGFGSMPLGNAWAFPTDRLTPEQTLDAMKRLAERLAPLLFELAAAEPRHPVDHFHALEPELFRLAEGLTRELALPVPIPRLAALVAASPFDAALHDAFGKANGVNAYNALGPDFASHDLAHYLDASFAGEYLDRHTSRRPQARMPLYHLVGALDPLTDSDLARRLDDGLPETLEEWVLADGLTHLKIKLNGDDLKWDIGRILAVHRVADDAAHLHGPRPWHYSLDFNERCPNVGYLIEALRSVRERASEAFERIQYVEQPTARDLRANPANRMHCARELKPVVIDESLVDYESLLLAEEMGYSGVALKACKGQSASLLLAAAARKRGLFLCVQDLTCTGAAFLQSAGLAARIPGVAAVEGNGRQYCPAANADWSPRFPATFEVCAGQIETGSLTGPGLGCVPPGDEAAVFDLGPAHKPEAP